MFQWLSVTKGKEGQVAEPFQRTYLYLLTRSINAKEWYLKHS